MPPRRPWVCVVLIAGLILASRLPQLLGPNLLVDGDESLLGLMARHVAQGREFPLFFYGQHYGLSTFEAGIAALVFLVAGTGAIQLKLAMLALWTIGVVWIFLALSRVVGERRSFWIAAVLALTPAWADASMNARGGYITAFTASAALAWVLAPGAAPRGAGRWAGAGLLTSIIYLGQPLWLPGVFPLVVAALAADRRASWAGIYVTAAAVPAAIVERIAARTVETWAGPPIGNRYPLLSLKDIGHQIYVSLTGAYYLWRTVDPPGLAVSWLAAAWCAALVALTLAQGYRLIKRRYLLLSHLLFLSVASTLVAQWLLLDTHDGRYLLPLAAPLVLLAGVELGELVDRRALPARASAVIVGILLIAGGVSMWDFRYYDYLWTNPPGRSSESARLHRLIGYLEANGAVYAFSMNGLLDSQLMFYSDEKITARWTSARGRYPAYVERVDHALARGRPVAVVGYTDTSGAPGCWDAPVCTGGIARLVPDPQTIFTVDGKYFAYVGADRQLLERLGFRFQD